MTRDELLQSFCDNDDLRPNLCSPFLQSGHVCATNAHYGIILPQEDGDFISYAHKDKPDMVHFLNQVGEPEIEISFKDINATLAEIEFQLAQIDTTCPECKGEGEVEFHYWDRHSQCHTTKNTCPECEGEGHTDIADYYSKNKYTYKLDDTYCFRVTTLRVIVKTMEYFHLDSITLLQSTTDDTFPFHIIGNDFHMICMPAKINQDEDEED